MEHVNDGFFKSKKEVATCKTENESQVMGREGNGRYTILHNISKTKTMFSFSINR